MTRIPLEALWPALFLLLTLVPSQQLAAGSAEGRRYFEANCAACHSTSRGENRIGPSLVRIIGRKSGTAPGFNYSPGLKAANITWNSESLDSWLQKPTNKVHTARMTISVRSRTDRQNLIAYLQTL
ncbi:MAG TPA: c-type cytochrome [Sphingomicrobium sp.]|nr:c-type cytochrome [Sphingomicrobium sp.]